MVRLERVNKYEAGQRFIYAYIRQAIEKRRLRFYVSVIKDLSGYILSGFYAIYRIPC